MSVNLSCECVLATVSLSVGAVFTAVPMPNLPVATMSPAVVKLSAVESLADPIYPLLLTVILARCEELLPRFEFPTVIVPLDKVPFIVVAPV